MTKYQVPQKFTRITATPLLALCVVGTATGCESVASEDIDTDAVYADIELVAAGDGSTTVRAALKVGGSLSNTFLDLSDGDTLIAYQGDDARRLSRHDSILGDVRYESRFDVDAADTPFEIAFLRSHSGGGTCEMVSAPSSTVTLPAPFEVDVSDASAGISRAADDLVVRWSPAASEAMDLTFSGDCVESVSLVSSPDAGMAVLRAGSLKTREDHDGESCQIGVALERHRSGDLDPNYGEGGRIVAVQRRSASVPSTP